MYKIQNRIKIYTGTGLGDRSFDELSNTLLL